MNFTAHIGIHDLPVQVFYEIGQLGEFQCFYVLTDGQKDILGFLSEDQIEDLEEQAQRHYMELHILKNEKEIKSHA